MEPSLLCSHFMTNLLQVTLYQTLFHGDASWVTSRSKFNIGDEMVRLVRESLKHPDLRAAPTAMDKQFPLHGAFERVCGNLQCTICVSCAGKTSEFGMRNACYVRSFTSEETLDIEKNSIETVLSLEKIAARDRLKDNVSRLLLADNVERNSLERTPRIWPKNRARGRVSRRILTDEEDSSETVFSSESAAKVRPKGRPEGKVSRLLSTCQAGENDLKPEKFKEIAKTKPKGNVLRLMTSSNIENCSLETKFNFDSAAKIRPKDNVSRLLQTSYFETNRLKKATQIRPKHRPRGIVSRLIPAGNDVFSYYKGEENAGLDRNESYILQAGETGAPNAMPPNNNSAELVLKSLPTRTDLTEITNELLDERDTYVDEVSVSSEDFPLNLETTMLKFTDIGRDRKQTNTVHEVRRIPKATRNVSSFSTVSDVPLMRTELRRKKQKQEFTAKEFDLSQTVPRSARRISNERSKCLSCTAGTNNEVWGTARVPYSVLQNKMVNFPLCFPSKSAKNIKTQNTRKPSIEQKNPVLIRKAKGLAFDGERGSMENKDESLSLSIVKQNSVYHVAIKNSDNRLGNVLTFKLYGSEHHGKRAEYRVPRKNSLSVTVIPTQRGN